MRVENLNLRTMSSVNLFYVTSWFLKVTINGGYLPYFRQYLLMNKSRHRSPPPRLKPELLIAQQPHLSNPTFSYLGLNPNKKFQLSCYIVTNLQGIRALFASYTVPTATGMHIAHAVAPMCEWVAKIKCGGNSCQMRTGTNILPTTYFVVISCLFLNAFTSLFT